MELNKVYCENCLDTMKRMPDGFVDLTVTSPPYDDLRTYNGYSFDFESVARELYRVTKQGGVVVWVVGDATKNGSESGTSFRQALLFKDCGFSLETMIYEKAQACFGSNTYYLQSFEYMFVLTKGVRPKTINHLRDRQNARNGAESTSKGGLSVEGAKKGRHIKTMAEFSKRKNIWRYGVGGGSSGHPAVFPEQLANDHIISWSGEGDLVYDPFSGSGTTWKMSLLNNRQFIGSEISEEYVRLSENRVKDLLPTYPELE